MKRNEEEMKRKQQDEERNKKLQKKLKAAFKREHQKATGQLPNLGI